MSNERREWDALMVLDAYRVDAMRAVAPEYPFIGSVDVLLRNLDAGRVAITADHGELLGELGRYGHFQSVPHPTLKRVPWVETTTTDHGTRFPTKSTRSTRRPTSRHS